MSFFENKTVLVTGGASGIGYLMGLKSLQRGASKLIIWDIDEDAMLQAASKLSRQGYEVETYQVDVSDPENIQEAAGQILENQPVDILFKTRAVLSSFLIKNFP